MTLDSPPVFSAGDYPDVDQNLLNLLNQSFEQVYNALGSIPTDGEFVGNTFQTNDAGAGYIDLKPDFKPTHFVISNISAESGALTAPYLATWAMTTAGNVRVSFVGLPASTKVTISAVYR